MAVGDLEYKSLGKRVGVITEPSRMKAVSWEFENLSKLIEKVEKYLTPYVWGHFNALVLPPSYELAGFENPLMAFLSPGLITGERS